MLKSVTLNRRPSRRPGRRALVEERWGYFFISPWLAGFLIFTVGPMIASLYFSLTRYEFPIPPKWIGLNNYIEAITRDELFPLSLLNTVYYVSFSVPLGLILAFSLALLLDRKLPARALWRTIYYLPAIVPTVASTYLFMYIFQPDYGLINNWLWSSFRITGPGWFNSRVWVKPTFITMSLWGAGGPRTIILLAALQNIPQELYEAAEVDGAGRWAKFASITVPMVSPTLFFLLVTGLIGAFKIFGPAYVATKGGPYYGSYFYVLHLFTNAFQHWNTGYACSLAWILFIIVLGVTLFQFKAGRSWVYYESGSMTADVS